jgi:hypothetical protein
VDDKRLADLPLSYGNPFLLIDLTASATFNTSVRLNYAFNPIVATHHSRHTVLLTVNSASGCPLSTVP